MHDHLDQSTASCAGTNCRSVLHVNFGDVRCERERGAILELPDSCHLPARLMDVHVRHVMEDLEALVLHGQERLGEFPLRPWVMCGATRQFEERP